MLIAPPLSPSNSSTYNIPTVFNDNIPTVSSENDSDPKMDEVGIRKLNQINPLQTGSPLSSSMSSYNFKDHKMDDPLLTMGRSDSSMSSDSTVSSECGDDADTKHIEINKINKNEPVQDIVDESADIMFAEQIIDGLSNKEMDSLRTVLNKEQDIEPINNMKKDKIDKDQIRDVLDKEWDATTDIVVDYILDNNLIASKQKQSMGDKVDVEVVDNASESALEPSETSIDNDIDDGHHDDILEGLYDEIINDDDIVFSNKIVPIIMDYLNAIYLVMTEDVHLQFMHNGFEQTIAFNAKSDSYDFGKIGKAERIGIVSYDNLKEQPFKFEFSKISYQDVDIIKLVCLDPHPFKFRSTLIIPSNDLLEIYSFDKARNHPFSETEAYY